MRAPVKHIVLMVVLAAALGLHAGTAHARSSRQPALGATESVVNAAWTRESRGGGCKRENLALTCSYVYRGVHIAVSFDQKHHAVQFQTDGRQHRSFDMWHFLNTLVPAGSKLRGCRFVPHSIEGGTAHACLYHLKQDIIVAYFPHPTDTDFGGLVTYDYEEYKDIQAGQ